jgi:methylthioribose-1-phosphate isomerase
MTRIDDHIYQWIKKQREAARLLEAAKKKVEKQRQKDLDKLKQQKIEEAAKIEVENEKKRKKIESELVRLLSNLTHVCFL